MKKIIAVIIFITICFTGCSDKTDQMDHALQLRARLLNAKSCSFDAKITADYGSNTYTFSMACECDEKGNVRFSLTEPKTIAGITGALTDGKGSLTFDDTALAFQLLADGQLTPVAAPWIFLNALRAGYITSCGKDGEYTRISLYDSYEADALQVDVWMEDGLIPVQGEILWKDRKILTIFVTNFQIL